MSIAYKVDKEKGITLVVWDGAVTEEQALAHLQRLLADPEWPGARRLHLTDLRTLNAHRSLDEASLQKIVDFLRSNSTQIAGVKMAIVANEAYHMSNTFQHLVSKLPITVIAFNSLDTACTWFNILAGETEEDLKRLRSGLEGGGSPAES